MAGDRGRQECPSSVRGRAFVVWPLPASLQDVAQNVLELLDLRISPFHHFVAALAMALSPPAARCPGGGSTQAPGLSPRHWASSALLGVWGAGAQQQHCSVATLALMTGPGFDVVGGRWLPSKQLCCVALFMLHNDAVTPCSNAAVSFFGRWKALPLIVFVRVSHTTLSFAS